MKRIIHGKRYDTETAEEVASYRNGLGRGDFRDLDETLYRTKAGAYFIHGEGGPMTRWAEPCGNMTGAGEGILVLSEAEAREWLEEHERTEALEKYFGGSIVDA